MRHCHKIENDGMCISDLFFFSKLDGVIPKWSLIHYKINFLLKNQDDYRRSNIHSEYKVSKSMEIIIHVLRL